MTVAVPPTIVAEKVIFAGKGRHRHVVGYELDFSAALDPARATSLANYTLTQSRRRGRQLVAQPVTVRAAYDATAHRVTLTLVRQAAVRRGGGWWSSPGRRGGSPTPRACRSTVATRAPPATTGPSSSPEGSNISR